MLYLRQNMNLSVPHIGHNYVFGDIVILLNLFIECQQHHGYKQKFMFSLQFNGYC
jgi:hypothetical protein